MFTDIDLDKDKTYSTHLDDIDAKIQELRRLQIKTDLKVQTLKSRQRDISDKFEEINANILKIFRILNRHTDPLWLKDMLNMNDVES